MLSPQFLLHYCWMMVGSRDVFLSSLSKHFCLLKLASLFIFVSLIGPHFIIQVDELLKQRDSIHSSFTVTKTANNAVGGSGLSNGSSSKTLGEDSKAESPVEDGGGSDGKDKSAKKKWFNLNLKGSGSDKKLG